ncbi:GDYXXLXY domain-containing protein [Desulfovibrio sp. OttesenSCG-928-O18]|nr:GDYXXLXY domain-containing protein [Desulfovibrio sp. OttesenSCG-928-O18]
MRRLYLLFVLAVFLAVFSFSVFRMEKLLANGADMLLPLAPVDPRALLMGDYMALDYSANGAIFSALRNAHGRVSSSRFDFGSADARWPDSGRAVMRGNPLKKQGGSGVLPPEALFVRLDDGTPLGEDEFFLVFKVRQNRIITAAPAFYFQEGHASVYERARYGRIKMDGSGKTLLVALCDGEGRDLRPQESTRGEAR